MAKLRDNISIGSHRKKKQLKRRTNKRRRKHKTIDELIDELRIDDHLIETDELFARYSTDPERGLTDDIAEEHFDTYGPNILTPTTVHFEFLKLFKAIFGGFSLLLWGGVFLCFLRVGIEELVNGHYDTENLYLGCILISIALITGVISHYQQSKSSRIIDSFKKIVPRHATVIREGILETILAEELTKGDLTTIKFGDRIPADIRIISSKDFKVDMSALTGETEPQFKSSECTNENPLETANLVFFSTFAVEGSCQGIVINVGDKTIAGQILGLASRSSTVTTQVGKEIRRLIRWTTFIALFLGSLFFILESSFGFDILQGLIYIVGIIVANVPEGLPITVTICLTLVAKRMAEKNCLIHNLAAVETLGSTSVIITDSTGVLTQNKMTVSHIWFDDKIFNVDIAQDGHNYAFDKEDAGFQALSRCAILCSQQIFDSTEENPSGVKISEVPPTETAILKCMEHVVGDLSVLHKQYPRVHEIPFSSTYKYHVSLHKTVVNGKDRILLTMKGAPERIFECCSTILVNGDESFIDNTWRNAFQEAYTEIAGLAERALGFCDLILPGRYSPDYEFDSENPNFPLDSLRFLGIISMIDPARPSTPTAIDVCKRAGIKVIMVTGDHSVTAYAFARSVGLISSGYLTPDDVTSLTFLDEPGILKNTNSVVIHGGTLKDMTWDELDGTLESYDEIIFARTTPRQKLLLVESCQRLGIIAAVTGSHPNDAPCLQQADIGVAMGISGSDVAKESADIILLDDNFSTIVTGIEEGRLIFDNLKKCIAYTLTSNVSETTPFFIFLFIGLPIPVGIITILCIDIGTDLIPAISISYEHSESDIMKRKPRNPKGRLINSRLLISCGNIGLIETLAGYFVYFVIMAENGFLPWDLVGMRELWESKHVNDLDDSYGQEWTYNQRERLLYTCQTGYFVTIIIVQVANVIICKTSRNSICHQGMRNWILNFGVLFELSLAATLIYAIPGTEAALNIYSLEWDWWLFPIPFSVFIFVDDELRRFMIRRYPGGWVDYETYY